MDPMGQSAIPQAPAPASPPAGIPPPQPQGSTVPPSAPTTTSNTPPSYPNESPFTPPPPAPNPFSTYNNPPASPSSSPFQPKPTIPTDIPPASPPPTDLLSAQPMDRPIQPISQTSPSPVEQQTGSFANFAQAATSQATINQTSVTDLPAPVPPGGKFYQSKKLIVAAIFIVVSLTTTGLILSQTQKPEPITTTDTQAFTPSPTPLTLSIESPKDETLVTDGTIVIKGETSPNTTVTFFTDTADDSVESDVNGNFQGSLPLENGINTLTITAYSESGEEKSITLDVVYDAENI